MNTYTQVLIERHGAADALEREVAQLRKELEVRLTEVIRSYMDAQYEREHGRSPDPLTWRTHRIEVSAVGESLEVWGEYLYGDEWEVRDRRVGIPLGELVVSVPEKDTAGRGSEARERDRETAVLTLLRREVETVRQRMSVPDGRQPLSLPLEEGAPEPPQELARRSLFVLCSQNSSTLWWPESVHGSLASAVQAAHRHEGRQVQWVSDADREGMWYSEAPAEWMIVQLPVPVSPGAAAEAAELQRRLEEVRQILYSMGELSSDRRWVTLPVWAMREISRWLRLPDVVPDPADL